MGSLLKSIGPFASKINVISAEHLDIALYIADISLQFASQKLEDVRM